MQRGVTADTPKPQGPGLGHEGLTLRRTGTVRGEYVLGLRPGWPALWPCDPGLCPPGPGSFLRPRHCQPLSALPASEAPGQDFKVLTC